MQASQREMLKAADQVAGAALPNNVELPGKMAPELPVASANSDNSQSLRSHDLVEPLIELKRQEQLFTASAKMVSIADKTLGSLIDVTS